MSAREKAAVKELFTMLTRAPLELFPAYGRRLNAPKEQGVYIIYGPKNNVLHVGRTLRAKGGIAQRLRNHL